MRRLLYVGILLLTLYTVKNVTSTSKRTAGFYCNDPKISHAFNGDTIPWNMVFIISLVYTFILISTTEFHLSLSFKSCRYVFHWYINFLVGALLNLVVVEVLKTLIAEHRPHFLHTCIPDQHDTCEDGAYIKDYSCKNTNYDDHFHKDSIKSFPSGHTSFSVYVGAFCLIYLTHRLAKKPLHGAIEFVLKLLCISWALFCSLSRITDRRHHWWDVLTGCIIGIFTVLYITKSLCKDFNSSVDQNVITPPTQKVS